MRIFILAAAFALAGCVTPAPVTTNSAGDYLSGRLAAGVNDIDGAADHYAKAVRQNPGDEELLRSAFLFTLASGKIEQSEPYARALASGKEPDALARYVLAAIKLRNGDILGAREGLKGEFDETFVKSIAFHTNAWVEAEIAGPMAGVSAFNLGKDVFTGFNPTFKAILKEEKGDYDGARGDHQMSVSTFGGPIGRAAYGAFLERRGAPQEARDYYGLLYQEGGAARRLALAAFDRIDRGAPSKAFTDVDAREGAALALYLFAGNVLQQSAEEMQRASEAGFKITQRPFNLPLALAQLAVYLDPSLTDAQRLVGSINNAYGNFDEARAAFAKIPPLAPEYEGAQIEIATSLAAEGREEEAIRTLKTAISRDRRAMEARLTLAGYYAEGGRHKEAVDVASSAIADLEAPPPEDAWRFFVTRAASLIELDRFPEAETDLKRAVEIAPDEPIALNYLGYSWAERDVNLDEAFALIEKAVALSPQSGAIIDSLGWAYYQRGEYEEALPHLENAASLEPGDPTVTDHLGDVYWRLGRETEARFQWTRALELDPKENIRLLIEGKLKSGLEPAAPAPTPPTQIQKNETPKT